ncbi:hypothetical protein D9M72_431810 [compost metagenome]
MPGNSLFTQVELSGNHAVGLSRRNEPQHFDLARREGSGVFVLHRRVFERGPGSRRGCAEGEELRAGRLEVHLCSIVVAGSAAGPAHKGPAACCLERNAQFPPEHPRASQDRLRPGGLSFGEEDGAPGLAGGSLHHRHRAVLRNGGQIVRGPPGRGGVPRGQLYFHKRRQQVAAGGEVGGIGRPPDEGARGRDIAKGQLQQGKSWLGLVTTASGVTVAFLRRSEVPPQALYFALLVEAAVERMIVPCRSQALRVLGRADGVIPGPVQPVQFGAVGLALAAEQDHVRSSGTPAVQRGSPLQGAAQVEGQVAVADDGAVDDARGHRRNLPRDHCHHHLVKEPNAAADVTEHQAGLPPAQQGEGDEVPVLEPFPDGQGVREDPVGTVRVAAV